MHNHTHVYSVCQTIKNFSNAMMLYNNAAKGAALAEKIYAQSEARYSAGMMSSFDRDDVRNQLLDSKVQELTTSLEWLNARVALQKALSAFE